MSYQQALAELNIPSPAKSTLCGCTRCARRAAQPEQMVDASTVRDVLETAKDVYETWEQLPEGTKEYFRMAAKALWPDLKTLQLRRLLATAWTLFAPARYRQLAVAARRAHIWGLVRQAGVKLRLPPPGARRPVTQPPGTSPTQVRAYHRRQRARGRVPGRAQQRRQRESEAQAEWESSELHSSDPYGLPRR